MFLIDWRLTLLSLGLLPFFLYLTYRVGKVRREVSTETQKSLAEMSATDRGDAQRQRHPAVEDVRPAGQLDQEVPRRQHAPGGPPDPPGDGRPLVLHDHRHDLHHHAGVRVLARRHARHPGRPDRADGRRHRRVHHPPEPAVLPARPAAQRPGRDPGRARPVRPDLRVPRDGPRDRRRAGRGGPRRTATSAGRSASATSRSATRPRPCRRPRAHDALARRRPARRRRRSGVALAAAPVDEAAVEALVERAAATGSAEAPAIEMLPDVRARGHRLRGASPASSSRSSARRARARRRRPT